MRRVWRTFLHHSKDWRFWVCWLGMSLVWPCLNLPPWAVALGSMCWGLFISLIAFPLIKEDE